MQSSTLDNNNTVLQHESSPECMLTDQIPLICDTTSVMEIDQAPPMQEEQSPLMGATPLSPEDDYEIQEIVQSYKSSLDIGTENLPPPEEKNSINDLVNVCEVSIRRVIDMAKKIKTFKALPQITQICLLKGGSIELLIIRSVLTYDKDRQQFLDQRDDSNTAAMTIDQFKQAATRTDEKSPGAPSPMDPTLQFSLVNDFMKYIKVLAIDLQADETMLILLLLISLFSPDRPNLDLKDVVAREQERFSMLLQRYIYSKEPLYKARILYAKLLMKLTDIRDLNEESSQVFLNMSTDTIQPLMKEVLDLKSNPSTATSPASETSSTAVEAS